MNTCPQHNKPLKQGKYGLYCNQPLVKSADGTQVLEWCHYKPGEVTTQPVQPPVTTQQPITQTPIQPVGQQSVKEVEEDQKVRGMIRHGLTCALIEKRGLETINPVDVEQFEGWVEWIVTGKMPKLKAVEDLSDEELEEVAKATNGDKN